MSPYALLADFVVVFHLCYVTFTVGGEIATLLGGAMRWQWIHNLPFRIVHAGSVVLVAMEAVIGASCPLTVWEYQLRRLAGQRAEAQISFVARLVRSIIFYDFPSWVFLMLYVGFAALVILTFILVPPRRKIRHAGEES